MFYDFLGSQKYFLALRCHHINMLQYLFIMCLSEGGSNWFGNQDIDMKLVVDTLSYIGLLNIAR
jgi:hypothetical protein